MLELDRAQVLATRVEAHHLNRRLDTDSSRDNAADSALVHGNPPSVRDDMMYALIESAAVCGVRDVQQSGILAFHARINGVHHDDLERTLDGRQLVKVASARGNISIVPARDVAVFTLGVLPGDEGSLRTYLKPFLPVLDESGMSAQGALDSVCEAAAEALADGPLDSAALSAALTRRLPALSAMCRGRCGSVHIEEGLFRLAGMGGTWCVGSHEGVRVHVRTDQWLDAATWQARPDRQRAREEMVRRYLVAFGPATPAEIGTWAAISPADARASLAAEDVGAVEVRVDGKRRSAHNADLDRWESPPEPVGVRLLPPYDPLLEGRDRSTLIADRELQKRVWRSLANPEWCWRMVRSSDAGAPERSERPCGQRSSRSRSSPAE
jgi:Winged helix DNA-binding domain